MTNFLETTFGILVGLLFLALLYNMSKFVIFKSKIREQLAKIKLPEKPAKLNDMQWFDFLQAIDWLCNQTLVTKWVNPSNIVNFPQMWVLDDLWVFADLENGNILIDGIAYHPDLAMRKLRKRIAKRRITA